MAKKVKRDGERKEEKKAVFEPPEFDERAYLKEEMRKIKSFMVFLVVSVPFGAVGAYLGHLTGSGWPGLIVAMGGIVLGHLALKNLLGIDLLADKKRDFLMPAGTYIVSWLVFAIVFSNPPFFDATTPSVADVRIYVQNVSDPTGDWTLYKAMGHDRDDPDAQLVIDPDLSTNFTVPEGSNVRILVRTGAPQGIENVSLTWWLTSPSMEWVGMHPLNGSEWDELGGRPTSLAGEHYYGTTLYGLAKGNLYFKIVIVAGNGNSRSFVTRHADTVPVT